METNPVVKGFVLLFVSFACIAACFVTPTVCCAQYDCIYACTDTDNCRGYDNSVVATPGWYLWNFGETTGGTSINARTGEVFMLNPSGLIPVIGKWTTGTCADFGLPRPLLPNNSLLKLGFDETMGMVTALPSNERYKVTVFDGFLFDNFEAVTYFRIEGTTKNQAVGLVFGCLGQEFYIARVGSEDDTATLYRYHDGKKYRIADAPVDYDCNYTLTEKWTNITRFENECENYGPDSTGITPGTWTGNADVQWGRWHELRVRRDNGVIDVSLDGVQLIYCLDLALRYGKIGFFTKGDTEAYFAGLEVNAWH